MKHLFLLVACIFASASQAEVTPPKGGTDSRIRVIDYNPNDVVKLSTFYGVSTHMQFEEGEVVIDKGLGDEKAWTVRDRANHLYIQPKAENADTNMTVVTSLRTYQFALIVEPLSQKDPRAWKNPNLIFSLKFRYPEQEAKDNAARAVLAQTKAGQEQIKSKLAAALQEGGDGVENYDYWVAGTNEISPTAVRDDGRFIYLTFSNNRDMPAIYAVGEDDSEALINTNVVNGNTIVVQRMVKQLMLRKGNSVASVLNKSFDNDGGFDNTTGTISADVERVIKGAKP